MTLLSARGVSVVHGRGEAAVSALDCVDVDIERGQKVALLGRSGSGKTTLLHVLSGLVEPTSGNVERNGRTAIVFQGANLLPLFSAVENLTFAGATPERARELLTLVGLEGKLDNRPGELSGGEAQRVAIARALAQSADAVLCDEPTGHLDSDTGARVLDLVEALQEQLGFALVLATHDEAVASRADSTIELRDGHVV
ncbi:MAG TPA: ABC transporter ATP-binding protein [Gaiellaceae bacterium]|nr:ABC transporter ATP-binding protein [Gaiellaceae bacterium]